MNYNERLLLYLIRIGLRLGEETSSFDFKENPDWNWIIKESSRQGTSAIALDGVEILLERGLIPDVFIPERKTKISWGFNVCNQEEVFINQFKIAESVANEFAKQGVRTAVLKGTAIARLYPIPLHRPCGDFDCFLLGDYEKGNVIAERMGADVSRYYYKHSHIKYKNLLIENHQFCTSIRGRKKNKVFEAKLQELLCGSNLIKIKGTNLLSPDPLFNALFLTVHAWGHFLLEGIQLRHVCDWAVLINKHVNDIDWEEFKTVIQARDKKMLLFAESFSIISHKYLECTLPDIFKLNKEAELRADKVIRSIFERQNHLYGRGFGNWTGRYMMVKNSVLGNWKYKEFSEDSVLSNSINQIVSFIIERHPHL